MLYSRVFLSWGGFLWGGLALILAIPYLSVSFSPIVDLPQQAAQIRLFLEMSQPEAAQRYVIGWWHPNHLSYLWLALGWVAGGAAAAGRWAMWWLGAFWLAGVLAVASAYRRPLWLAGCAGILFFNFTMYWGFYSFLTGQAVFFCALAWWQSARMLRMDGSLSASSDGDLSAPSSSTLFLGGERRLLFGIFLWSFLLYAAHILWWAFALCALGGSVFFSLLRHGLKGFWRRERQRILAYLCGGLPSLLLVGAWWLEFSQEETTRRLLWGWPWYMRISPSYLAHFSLGALQGWQEEAALAFLLIASLASRFLKSAASSQPPSQARESSENGASEGAGLWGLCAMALLLVFFLPSTYKTTGFMGERWMPSAMLFFLLAISRLEIPRWAGITLAWSVMLSYTLWTTAQWREIERIEYSGLQASLQALPQKARVLGLDLKKRSAILRIHRPFLQGFAYAQLLQGAQINASFTAHASSLIRERRPHLAAWTHGLDWYPERFQITDMAFFSHLLLHATPAQHRAFQARYNLIPLQETGFWRLYRSPSFAP